VPLGRRPALRSVLRALLQSRRTRLLSDSILFDRAHIHAQRPEIFTARNPIRALAFNPVFALVDPNPLFSARAYLRQRPDVAASGVHPVLHYLEAGRREGMQPHPLFDAAWYLANNPDIARTGQEPFSHWILGGWREGRDPHPLVSVRWLQKQWRDRARAAGAIERESFQDPLTRYVHADDGWRVGVTPHPLLKLPYIAKQLGMDPEADWLAILSSWSHALLSGHACDPHPLFSVSYYRSQNPDVAERGLDPLTHYLTEGWREGRKPHPLFDPAWYLRKYPDVEASGQEPLSHYLVEGADEGRQPGLYFDPDWFGKTSGASGSLADYLEGGWRKTGASPHPLFDTAWYLSQNPDVAATGVEPLLHYVSDGWRQHRAPHPLFDVRWHLDRVEAARASGLEPLGRFLETGAAAGEAVGPYFDAEHYKRACGKPVANALLSYVQGDHPDADPHPLFDEAWYASNYGQRMGSGFAHYLREGRKIGLKPHTLFDPGYYRSIYPDIEAEGAEPLLHYWTRGGREGRNPHPLFDGRLYLERYPDVAAAGLNPLGHYLESGNAEGREAHPLFDTPYYQAQLRDRSPRRTELRTGPAHASAPAATYVYTSAALNYAHMARLLAKSVKQHHPDFRTVIVLSERKTAETERLAAELTEFDEIWFLEDLGLPDLWSWTFEHTIVELCTAVKGWAADILLQRAGVERVLYLDPDVVVLNRLEPVLDALKRSSIVVTPHQLDPDTTREGIIDNEISSLLVGVYNLGFLALRADEEGRRFGRWWRDRLLEFCFEESAKGVYTDQRWVDFAPAFFEHVDVLRHPGCNFARWNLSQRWVTGAVPDRLVVNAQRAIFFHCSGTGNGRLSLSEAKHAHDMPAFKALLAWYDARTRELDHPGFSKQSWSLATYDNGEPITVADRRAWRTRRHSGQDGRNPFMRTGAPASSGDRAEALSETRLLRMTPLEHYLRIGSAQGVAPNIFFDPAFYLGTNADVAANDLEPLTHYAAGGWREGRAPHPQFDTEFYKSQLPGDERAGDALQHYLQKGARLGLRVSQRFSRPHDADAIRRLKHAVGRERPALLFFAHGLGGGVRAHIDRLVEIVHSEVDVLLLEPDLSNGFVRLEALTPALQTSLWFDPAGQRDELVAFLRELRVVRAHVHHWMGMDELVRHIVQSLDIRFDVTLHDYYALAPQPFLTGDDGRFVGEALEQHEDELIRNGDKSAEAGSLASWHARSRQLLGAADRILAPSLDLSERIARQLGQDLKPRLTPHPETSTAQIPTPPRKVSGIQPLRIALIGSIAIHKGLPVVVRCAQIAKAHNLPLEFVCLGTLALPASDLDGLPLKQTGPYPDEEAASLLAGLNADCAWFPTLWPETYCFTLSHALRSGLPIAAGRLGAFEERLEGRAHTWLMRWDLDPEEWIAFFLRLRTDVFAEPREKNPIVSGDDLGKITLARSGAGSHASRAVVNVDYYRSEYLAPVLGRGSASSAVPSIARIVS
jgi:hypothetical protein